MMEMTVLWIRTNKLYGTMRCCVTRVVEVGSTIRISLRENENLIAVDTMITNFETIDLHMDM